MQDEILNRRLSLVCPYSIKFKYSLNSSFVFHHITKPGRLVNAKNSFNSRNCAACSEWFPRIAITSSEKRLK